MEDQSIVFKLLLANLLKLLSRSSRLFIDTIDQDVFGFEISGCEDFVRIWIGYGLAIIFNLDLYSEMEFITKTNVPASIK